MVSSRAADNEMRVLITGANGFVGRHLVAHLCMDWQSLVVGPSARSSGQRTDRLRIFAGLRKPDAAQSAGKTRNNVAINFDKIFDQAGWGKQPVEGQIEIVSVELEDSEDLARQLAQVQPHHIYHLAARSSGAAVDREAVYAANVAGTRNLLEAASLLSPFPHVLLASTGYVYGNTDPLRPAREEDPIGPLWKYGAYTDSKIEMETVARAYRAFAFSVRAFAHTGPGQTQTFAVPGFARQIVRMERSQEACELRVGNLEAYRDILDVRDVVRAYALLMERADWGRLAGSSINIATGHPVHMHDVVQRLCALSRVSPTVVVDPARLRPLDIACSTGNPSILKSLTDWQPQRSLDTTLQDMLAYWREQPTD